jgi:hypothetical protein
MAMKLPKNNNIILIESGNLVSSASVKNYRQVCVYSGTFNNAEKLPDDFVGQIEHFDSYKKANMSVDWVYSQYVKNEEAQILNKAIGDERAYIIIKKTILYALVKLFFSFILAEKFIEKRRIGEAIDFIPSKFSYTLFEIVSKKEGFLTNKLTIPLWYLNKMRRREVLKNIIIYLALNFYPVAIALVMNAGKIGKSAVKNYKYGVHIWNSWVRSAMPSYRMDFLESEDGLNPANTLYIIEREMSRDNLEKVMATDYDCCYFKDMLHKFSMWQYLKQIYHMARKIAKKLLSAKSKKILVNESYIKLLRWYISWEVFYSRHSINISIASMDPGSPARQLLQERHGSRNIFIYRGANIANAYDPSNRKKFNDYAIAYYSLLCFDVMISNRMSNNFFKENSNLIKKYVDCGIFHSDIIYRVKHDPYLKMKIRRELRIPEGRTVIGFFDTIIGGINGVYNNYEGYKVIKGIYSLLESNKNYYLIYRSRNIDGFLGGSDVKKALDRLILHDRAVYLNWVAPNYNADNIIGACDLCVGCFLSSVPQESVAGGIPAICYMPSDRFAKDFFVMNKFPNFYASGYKQLKERVDYWLNQTNEDDFSKFQNEYIKKHIDTYCDGRATSRLHSFIKTYN